MNNVGFAHSFGIKIIMKPLDKSDLKTNMKIVVFNKKTGEFRKDIVTFASKNHPGKILITLRSTGMLKEELIFYLDGPGMKTRLLLMQKKLLEKVD